MNIKQIRVVNLDIPLTPPKSKSRRPAANKVSARRAVPINYYEEFSTKFGPCPAHALPMADRVKSGCR